MKKWIQAIRLSVLAASVLPAILGGVYAYYETGTFKTGLFLLTLLGIALVHTGANLINDYFDYRSGADTANTEFLPTVTGGSRVIVDGSFTPLKALVAAIISFALGTLDGIYLAIQSGPAILWFVGIGLLTSIIYTTPRFNLINMKMGEWVIGLDFGVLTILGAYYVQASRFSLNALLVSIPVGILIAAILLVNEFQDYASDKAVGKKTTVVRIGRKAGAKVLTGMLASVLLLIAIDVIVGALPLWSLVSLASLPLFYHASRIAARSYDQPETLGLSNMSVIMGQLVLLIALVFSILVPSSPYYLLGFLLALFVDFMAMKQTGIIRG